MLSSWQYVVPSIAVKVNSIEGFCPNAPMIRNSAVTDNNVFDFIGQGFKFQVDNCILK
jgi:hypothetical protein